MADPPEEKRDQPKQPEGMTPEDAAARLNEILSSPIENPFASVQSPSGSHAPTQMGRPKPAQPPGPRGAVRWARMPRARAAAATPPPHPALSATPEFATWDGARTAREIAADPAPATSPGPAHAADRKTMPAAESETTRPVSEP